MSTTLQELKRLILDVKTMSGWSVKAGLAAPLLDFIVRLGPPWPLGVPVISSLIQLLSLIVLLTVARSGRYNWRRTVISATTVTVLAFTLYMTAYSHFVASAPDGTRVVTGYEVRPDVEPVVGHGGDAEDWLPRAEWKADAVWTRRSITIVRISLLASWSIAFAGFVIAIGAFAQKGYAQVRSL